jgi:uncharacterized protein YecE (DUF72 family)
VDAIAGNWGPRQDVYVFFNNDQHGAAPKDALALAKPAREAGLKVKAAPASHAR